MRVNKLHTDALEAFCRNDGELAIATARQLEQIREGAYDVKYPELKGRGFVPVNNSINEGAQSYTVHTMDIMGTADFVEDFGSDAPLSDVKLAAEDNYKMRRIQSAYRWTYDELLAAKFIGQDLSGRKANACRTIIERTIDKSLLIGFTSRNMQGLFTLSGVQAPVTYTPGVTTFEDETPDAMAADLNGICANLVSTSKEVESPNRLGLAISTAQLIQDRRMGQGSNQSVWDYVQGVQSKRRPDFQIVSSAYLEASGGHSGGAVKRMVAWEFNPDVLEGWVNEAAQMQPEYKGLSVVTLMTARIGGVGTHRPKGISYGDNV